VSETIFTYDDADAILRGDGQSDFVGINAIDGLIAAVAAGPAFIPTHEWLPQIFGKRNPLQTPGTSEHRLVWTVLHRHDEVVEILANRPEAYLPLLLNAQGRAVMTDWSIGFLLGVGMRSNAWGPLMISDFGMTLAPILSVNPMGRELMLRVSQAEIDRIAATAHETIAGAVVALYRHCAAGRPASRRLAKLRGGRRR
jgi:yecA family protein